MAARELCKMRRIRIGIRIRMILYFILFVFEILAPVIRMH